VAGAAQGAVSRGAVRPGLGRPTGASQGLTRALLLNSLLS
jgi:hypothetical protein